MSTRRTVSDLIRLIEDFPTAQFDLLEKSGDTRKGLLYFNGLWGFFTVCRITIRSRPERTVVMMTEPPDNPGLPVTRISEVAASFIHNTVLRFFHPEEICWIEHYAPTLPWHRDRFFLVTYEYSRHRRRHIYSSPSWKRITKPEVDALMSAAP